MRKRIGMFIGEINDNIFNLVKGVNKYAKEADMDTFVFVNFGIYDSTLSQYTEGEKAFYKLPDFDSFSGFIIYEGMLNIEGIEDELYEYLLMKAKCPVIYIKSERNGFYSIVHDDKQAMKDITNHLINKYGIKDICHMSGRMALFDARERLAGYKEAMQEAGLTVTPQMIYNGEYYIHKTKEALDYFYASRGHYPEAIVCANDHMAVSVVEELTRRNVKVPEEVLVSGYDNMLISKNCLIPVTTFETDFELIAREAIDIIEKIKKGETVEEVTHVNARMVLRRSTEREIANTFESNDFAAQITSLQNEYAGLEDVFFLNSALEVSFSEEELYSTVDYYYADTCAQKSYVCLTTDAFKSAVRPADKISDFTDSVILKRIYYQDKDRHYDSPEYEFATKDLLPEEYLLPEASLYYVNTIHSGMKVYGYMISIFPEDKKPNRFMQSYTGGIGRVIENFNIRNEFLDIGEMKRAYLLDTLTGLYNRKGYERNLQILEDRAKRHTLYISVVSIDMDGLKYINDNFGHTEGDIALSEFASVLIASLEEGEIAARYGGDEFAAVLLSRDPARHIRFEKRLEQNLNALNETAVHSYMIHASVGVVNMTEHPELSTTACLKKADELMYKNKVAYKKEHGELPR